MFQNDYILRMIEDLGRVLSRLVNGKSEQLYSLTENTAVPSAASESTDLISYRLSVMIKEGKLSEAEDLLFDEAEGIGESILPIGLSFYYTLAAMDDASLEKGGFSREEITVGVRDMLRLLGLEGFADF